MMNLNTQILSIFFSFLFGIVFSMCTSLNYKYLFHKKLSFQIIFTIIYVIDFTLLYFIMIKKINNGIIHSYFMLSIMIGYFVSSITVNKRIDLLRQKSLVKKVSTDKKNNEKDCIHNT